MKARKDRTFATVSSEGGIKGKLEASPEFLPIDKYPNDVTPSEGEFGALVNAAGKWRVRLVASGPAPTAQFVGNQSAT